MIYLLPLEKLKERYTDWWAYFIPQQITNNRKPFTVIGGDSITSSVEVGTVLDAGGTNYFKATQLQKISRLFIEKQIQPHDSFLICDIWFPGIEMIRYMSQLYQIPVSIWGVWHAGSTTHGDFAEPMHNWSKYFEIGFLNICNGIFVGSEYSKNSIVERLLYAIPQNEAESIADRIYPYGMPLNYQELQQYKDETKKNIILFPHRPDIEKNPHIFMSIIRGLSTFWDEFDAHQFVFCTSKPQYKSQNKWINAMLGDLKSLPNVTVFEALDKSDYYKLVAQSKMVISTTAEENFGYCIVEALALGTQVLAPNAFSYSEILEEDNRMLYNNYDELMEKIIKTSQRSIPTKELKILVEPYEQVVNKWLEIMGA